MNLTTLWDSLSRVKSLKLNAVSRLPVWDGVAEGRVDLTKVNADTLIYSESGEWSFEAKPRIKFFNVYRWRRLPEETLELSHLRHGINSPVHLLNFKLTSGGNEWRSGQPHLCREDIYSANLFVEKNSIRLKWEIDGPAKRQTVECFYQ